MTIDKQLLEILRCPVTKQQVFPLSTEKLDMLNNEIISGTVFQADGNTVKEKILDALITENKNRIYRIEKNIPIMLEDESILTDQIPGFHESIE
ncbi:MAG: hypothetical protein CL402_08405 [Acidiferrobacteraceae bacterium]|nr:hypothetical protein [Acidiferrobacteraceae bacterium]|tara:strand:+ start:1121 stop:1402 length:282 start_codon:yes stop_codon:yes gene_type:complete